MVAFPVPTWTHSYNTLNKMNHDLGLDITLEIKPVIWHTQQGDYLRIDLSNLPTVHVECFEGFDPRRMLPAILSEPGARRKGGKG